jgi:hypothetical protein
MEKNILSFKQFLNEDVNSSTDGSSESATGDSSFKRPETEREAKSRIAQGIVRSIFGDVEGLTGGFDSIIDQTKEVKESLPYKGCGISDPFKLEKTPLSVPTIKILLEYLNEKGVGRYDRALKEIEEKRRACASTRAVTTTHDHCAILSNDCSASSQRQRSRHPPREY